MAEGGGGDADQGMFATLSNEIIHTARSLAGLFICQLNINKTRKEKHDRHRSQLLEEAGIAWLFVTSIQRHIASGNCGSVAGLGQEPGTASAYAIVRGSRNSTDRFFAG